MLLSSHILKRAVIVINVHVIFICREICIVCTEQIISVSRPSCVVDKDRLEKCIIPLFYQFVSSGYNRLLSSW